MDAKSESVTNGRLLQPRYAIICPMASTKHHQRKLRTAGSPNRTKGRLLEAIVASMHDVPGAQIRQNVKLPVVGSDMSRRSEIDVLIDGAVAGYPIRIAIECKNEKAVVDTPKVNTFLAKLDDVGIPRQHGVLISIKGFTRGALERARKEGLRTLVLTGLTEERLAEVLHQAMQAVIHLWPVLEVWHVQNDVDRIDGTEDLGVFYNDSWRTDRLGR